MYNAHFSSQTLSSHSRPRRHLTAGVALTEAAIVLPFLLVLIGGVFYFGQQMNAQSLLTNTANEAARMLSKRNEIRDAGGTRVSQKVELRAQLEELQGPLGPYRGAHEQVYKILESMNSRDFQLDLINVRVNTLYVPRRTREIRIDKMVDWGDIPRMQDMGRIGGDDDLIGRLPSGGGGAGGGAGGGIGDFRRDQVAGRVDDQVTVEVSATVRRGGPLSFFYGLLGMGEMTIRATASQPYLY